MYILSVQATRILFRLCFVDLNSKTKRNHFSLSVVVCMIVAINNQWSEQNGLSKTKKTIKCGFMLCAVLQTHTVQNDVYMCGIWYSSIATQIIEKFCMEMQWYVCICLFVCLCVCAWILKFCIQSSLLLVVVVVVVDVYDKIQWMLIWINQMKDIQNKQ